MKPSIEILKDIHAGRPVAVLGGGPSLPGDVGRLPAGAVLISVNHHALKLVKATYLVICDQPREYAAHEPDHDRHNIFRRAVLGYRWENYGALVSPLESWSDFRIDVNHWDCGFSSSLATWLACYLGGDPVLLCGMDCYQGQMAYFYEAKPANGHPVFNYPLENHLKAWRPALEGCPHAERIRAVSGPLCGVFGKWD